MLIGLFFVLGAISFFFLYKYNKRKTISFVVGYRFSSNVLKVFKREYPQYDEKQTKAAFSGLKEYLLLHSFYPNNIYGMPSKLADDAWHAFMLCSKEYDDFCKKAYGRYLHHSPDTNCNGQILNSSSIFKDEIILTYKVSKRLYSEYDDLLRLQHKAIPLIFLLDRKYLNNSSTGYIYNDDALIALDFLEKSYIPGKNKRNKKDDSDVDLDSGGGGGCSSSYGDCGSSSCGDSGDGGGDGGGCGGGCGGGD